MPTTHTDKLWQLALTKWAGIASLFPDLAPALTLQKAILRLLIDAREQMEDSPPVMPDLPQERISVKWARGVPALRNEMIPIPDALRRLLSPVCDALSEGGAGDSAAHIRDALAEGEIDSGSLLRVSLARNREAIRTSSLHHGFSPDLVWVIGELASSPLAHYCQAHILGGGELDLAAREWDQGYCPCCGSWPALIEVLGGRGRGNASRAGGTGRLRCSYCAATWQLSSHRCVYCRNDDGRFVIAAPDVERAGRRLELCGACGSYTKVMDALSLTPFPLLAIEDLATMDLDQGAMGRGYQRPDLPDLDAIDPPSSPGCS